MSADLCASCAAKSCFSEGRADWPRYSAVWCARALHQVVASMPFDNTEDPVLSTPPCVLASGMRNVHCGLYLQEAHIVAEHAGQVACCSSSCGQTTFEDIEVPACPQVAALHPSEFSLEEGGHQFGRLPRLTEANAADSPHGKACHSIREYMQFVDSRYHPIPI